mgnify:CR=1 FL=1
MKLSKQQLKRIIREEKQKLQELDFSGPAVGSDADVYGTPEQAEIEDALIACFCDWSSDGATATMSFNEFMLEVAKKLGVTPQLLAQSCELIRTGAM